MISANMSCEGIGAVLVLMVVIVDGRQASTLETLCACGRPEWCMVVVVGRVVVGSGEGEARLGIERVLRNLRTGGERLPSWVEGDFGGVCTTPFLNMTGGKKECTLIRGRRCFPCDTELCEYVEEVTESIPVDFTRVLLMSTSSIVEAAGADISRCLGRISMASDIQFGLRTYPTRYICLPYMFTNAVMAYGDRTSFPTPRYWS